MLKLRSLVVISVLLLMLVPVTSAFAEEGQKNIIDTAVSAGQFQTLVAAVTKADLAETLGGEGPFTVFAPTDDAFTALLNKLGATPEELLSRTDLKDILLYHVVQGNVKSTDLTDGMKVTTLAGQELTVTLNPVKVNDANVVTADIETSNGVIHVIDAVLLPAAPQEGPAVVETVKPDIVDTAVAAGSFNTLAAALQKANLVDALKGEGPFTVFAPSDDAFAALLSKLGVTADELLARKDLSDILLYHVVKGAVKSSDLKDGAEVETLNGKKVIISLQSSPMVNDSNIVTADIEASNGYIHVIDAVLLPPADENVVANPKTGSSSVAPYVWMAALSAMGLGALYVTRSKKGTEAQ